MANLFAHSIQLIISLVSVVVSLNQALADRLPPSFVLILLCLDFAVGLFARRSDPFARIIRATWIPMRGVTSAVNLFLLWTYLRLAFPDSIIWLTHHYFVAVSTAVLILIIDSTLCPIRWLLRIMRWFSAHFTSRR